VSVCVSVQVLKPRSQKKPILYILRLCCNPTLAKCGGEAQHLEKLGIWSPLGLPNVQSSIARPKTPRIGVFLVSLEISWNVDIENGLALVIWTSISQVMGKRRAGSQTGSLTPELAVWLPTTKSRESTFSQHLIWECDMALERSRRGYNFGSDFVAIGLCSRKLWPSKVPRVQSGQFRDSISGVSRICAIWM
jgi:hypothetical protein